MEILRERGRAEEKLYYKRDTVSREEYDFASGRQRYLEGEDEDEKSDRRQGFGDAGC